MHNKRFSVLLLSSIVAVLLGGIIFIVFRVANTKSKQYRFRDFQTIKEIKTLRIGILPDEMDYFLDDGKVSGFQYEILENMASYYGLATNYIVNKTIWDNLYSLWNDEVDILAMNIPYLLEIDLFADYTETHSCSQQVIVQRKDNLFFQQDKTGQISCLYPDTTCRMLIPYEIDNTLLHVLKNSIYGNISLLLTDEKNMNAVFEQILHDSADATICDARFLVNQQKINKNIDYHVVINEEKQYHWLVFPSNYTLLDSVNLWLKNFKQTKTYRQLIAKYYDPNSLHHKKLINSSLLSKNNHISPYDTYFQRYAKKYGIDWRLLAAVAYQESRFKPSLIGRKGSFGIMQITPQTSEHFGVSEMETIEQQIESGAKVLASHQRKMQNKGIDNENMPYFVLAAYNAGFMRMEDAMKIAEFQHKDATKWENIKETMLDLNNNNVRKKLVLQTGKYNAKHTLKYVNEVSITYRHYCNLVE